MDASRQNSPCALYGFSLRYLPAGAGGESGLRNRCDVSLGSFAGSSGITCLRSPPGPNTSLWLVHEYFASSKWFAHGASAGGRYPGGYFVRVSSGGNGARHPTKFSLRWFRYGTRRWFGPSGDIEPKPVVWWPYRIGPAVGAKPPSALIRWLSSVCDVAAPRLR